MTTQQSENKSTIDVADMRDSSLEELCRGEKQRVHDILAESRRTFGLFTEVPSRLLLPLADRRSRRWLHRTGNPYREEIDRFAGIMGEPGLHALNLSYEWCCTSGVYATSEGPRMLRILDWPFPGLGKRVMAIRQSGSAGEFCAIGWPGVSGLFQAIAPGRFAAAINQAPMRRHGYTLAGDWLINRRMVDRSSALPPAHLLRQAFEQAKDYTEAKKMLSETPVCIPVIYILSGTEPGEGCIIEKLEDKAFIRELGTQASVTVANQFQSEAHAIGKGWHPRMVNNNAGRERQAACIDPAHLQQQDFGWLERPMINSLTRLVMVADAGMGMLRAQGREKDGPATALLHLGIGLGQESEPIRKAM